MKSYCVGITGNIASGKSSVTKYLADHYKIPALDMDKVVHQAYEQDKTLITKIVELYGEHVRGTNGIDRHVLGKYVFDQSPEAQVKKSQLEQMVWSVAAREFYHWKNAQQGLCVAEINLLYEAHWENNVDKILFVYCNDAVRKQRLMARNKFTEEEALSRMNAQMPQEDKVLKTLELNGCLIDNSDDLAGLHVEIDRCYGDMQRKITALSSGSHNK